MSTVLSRPAFSGMALRPASPASGLKPRRMPSLAVRAVPRIIASGTTIDAPASRPLSGVRQPGGAATRLTAVRVQSNDSKTDSERAGREFRDRLARGVDVAKVFDQNEWRRHQMRTRYIRAIFTVFRSRVLRNVFWTVAFIAGVAAAAVHCYSTGVLLTNYGITLPVLPMMPFNITAATLGLLLVFRTNSSYGRFDEARKLWGLTLNRLRDVNRQCATWANPQQPALQRWSIAFAFALKCHIRGRPDLVEEYTAPVLQPQEVAALINAVHMPLYCLQVMSEVIRTSDANPYYKALMDANLTVFNDTLGACERLLRTPIPLAYTRHTARALIIWLTLLPIAMAPTLGWSTVPAIVMISFFMLGVEEIGVEIEEPFTVLPLDAICNTASANTAELLAQNVEWGPEKPSPADMAEAAKKEVIGRWPSEKAWA